MLNYVHLFCKIRVVFHTLYLFYEFGDRQFFFFFFAFAFATQVIQYLTAVKVKKTSIDQKIFAQTSLNPVESENRFCISLLNSSIQDLSDQGAWNEPKNPLPIVCDLRVQFLIYWRNAPLVVCSRRQLSKMAFDSITASILTSSWASQQF